jgi:hypothetical protein
VPRIQTTAEGQKEEGFVITFSNTFTANALANQNLLNSIAAAESFIQSNWTNTVTISVKWDAQMEGINGTLAHNEFGTETGITFAQLTNALIAHGSPPANFPATDPSGGLNWTLPEAYARMLGIPGAPTGNPDDTVTLNTSYSWAYNGDVTGTLIHELSEGGMGRIGGLGFPQPKPGGTSLWSTMDLFRYNASHQHDYANGTDGLNTFFSIDGGTTLSSLSYHNQYDSLLNFFAGDTADFTTNDIFGTGTPGTALTFSNTDFQIMNALGWEVPGPSTITGEIFLHTGSGQNAFWLMNESVRQGSGTNLPFTGPTWQGKAFVDHDPSGPNFSDVLWQNDNGAVAIWQLQGATPVHQNNLGQNPGPTWHVEAAKDFDGNGVADVLLQNNNGALALWELQNTANGPNILNQFNIGQNPGPTWHAVAAGDFNGDGRAGILFFNDNGVSAAIWEMTPGGPAIGPNGVFTQQVNLPSTGSSTWKPVAVADFNGDGKDDIVWQNTNGTVAIWEMTANAAGAPVVKTNGQFNIDGTQSVGPSWHVVAARDFNNDGRADLLWQNDNGAIALWENFTEGPVGSFHASFTAQHNITPQPNPPGVLDWHIA